MTNAGDVRDRVSLRVAPRTQEIQYLDTSARTTPLQCEMLDMLELRFPEVNGFEFRHKGVEARPWLVNQSLVVNHLVVSPSSFYLLLISRCCVSTHQKNKIGQTRRTLQILSENLCLNASTAKPIPVSMRSPSCHSSWSGTASSRRSGLGDDGERR